MEELTPKMLIDGLLFWIGLVILLTFHEFGHAWTALKCGDNTAKLEGRVSLNPLVHIDLIGTVIIPLAMIFLTAGGFLIGWAKPVPVNIGNLRHPRRDDVLVTLAGPGMNVLLALALIILARVGMQFDAEQMKMLCLSMAHLSLLLCFFNLIPVPPLDGSRVMRVVTGMSWETFARFAQWGFVILIILLQLQPVRVALAVVTDTAFVLMALPFGLV
jgi:Zn-dependent protease